MRDNGDTTGSHLPKDRVDLRAALGYSSESRQAPPPPRDVRAGEGSRWRLAEEEPSADGGPIERLEQRMAEHLRLQAEAMTHLDATVVDLRDACRRLIDLAERSASSDERRRRWGRVW